MIFPLYYSIKNHLKYTSNIYTIPSSHVIQLTSFSISDHHREKKFWSWIPIADVVVRVSIPVIFVRQNMVYQLRNQHLNELRQFEAKEYFALYVDSYMILDIYIYVGMVILFQVPIYVNENWIPGVDVKLYYTDYTV